MDIGPGDWVECVNPEAEGIRYGSLYCVCDAGDADYGCETCGEKFWVDLIGVPADPDYGWCCGCEVRPIYRPRNSTLIADLTKTPAIA